MPDGLAAAPRLQARMLADGRRLHLSDGPIDLVIEAWGTPEAVRTAYQAATLSAATVLDGLCAELPALRSPQPGPQLTGPVARVMQNAVAPHAVSGFITPMAAVAGAVAQHVLSAMTAAAPLTRAYVNNGGDIALHLDAHSRFAIGVVGRIAPPTLAGRITLQARDGVRGVATSGWPGRSFSRGIADAVTVLAATASAADAAATVIANAVDLPGHPAIRRVAANLIAPDSDLGDLPVTRDVGLLSANDIQSALSSGAIIAEALRDAGLIIAAFLHVQGETRIVAPPDLLPA